MVSMRPLFGQPIRALIRADHVMQRLHRREGADRVFDCRSRLSELAERLQCFGADAQGSAVPAQLRLLPRIQSLGSGAFRPGEFSGLEENFVRALSRSPAQRISEANPILSRVKEVLAPRADRRLRRSGRRSRAKAPPAQDRPLARARRLRHPGSRGRLVRRTPTCRSHRSKTIGLRY